jgi:hypothetical protein
VLQINGKPLPDLQYMNLDTRSDLDEVTLIEVTVPLPYGVTNSPSRVMTTARMVRATATIASTIIAFFICLVLTAGSLLHLAAILSRLYKVADGFPVVNLTFLLHKVEE